MGKPICTCNVVGHTRTCPCYVAPTANPAWEALTADRDRLRGERDEARAEVERLRDQVIRLQSQIKDWHDQNRPLCEVKGCKRMATGEAERSGVWWRVCEKHHVAVESTGEQD